jgi:hypothetical protein
MERRRAIALVENLVLAGQIEHAARLYRRARIDLAARGETPPEIFERWLEREPWSDLAYETRALFHAVTGDALAASCDLVRGLLVTRRREASSEMTAVLTKVGAGVALPAWAVRSLSAVSARLARDRSTEHALLLEASRLAPTEKAVLVALARFQAPPRRLRSSSEAA